MAKKEKTTPAQANAGVLEVDPRAEIAEEIFMLFEKNGCSVGAAELIMNDVKQMIWEMVPVRSGFYEPSEK